MEEVEVEVDVQNTCNEIKDNFDKYIELIILGKQQDNYNLTNVLTNLLKKFNLHNGSEITINGESIKISTQIDNQSKRKLICQLLNFKCNNIFTYITPECLIKTYSLDKQVQNDTLFTKSVKIYFTKTIEEQMTNNKAQILGLDEQTKQEIIEKTEDIMSKPAKSQSIAILDSLFTNYYNRILEIMDIEYIITKNNKTPYYCIILYILSILNVTTVNKDLFLNVMNNNDTDINNNVLEDVQNMNNIKKYTLDARQNIAVQRFAKFNNLGDKACFLFHGVGTGKTMTSMSILLTHLSSVNIQGSQKFKSFKILVIAPSGLFRASFLGDCKKMGIYVYNIIVNNVNNDMNITFETCTGLLKTSDNRQYIIEFAGYDYDSLFNGGFEKLPNKNEYDVVIFDEAHRLLTKNLPSEDIRDGKPIWNTFELDCSDDTNLKIKKQPTTEKNMKNALRDNNLIEFVSSKKQTIFLTGTPIQTSPEDIIDIAWFLNCPNINKTNNVKFIADCKSGGGNRGIFQPFYSRLSDLGRAGLINRLKIGVDLILHAAYIAAGIPNHIISIPFIGSKQAAENFLEDLKPIKGGGNFDIIKKDFLKTINTIIEKPTINNIIQLIQSNTIITILKTIDPNDDIISTNDIECKLYGKLFEYYIYDSVLSDLQVEELSLNGGKMYGGDGPTEAVIGIGRIFFGACKDIAAKVSDIINNPYDYFDFGKFLRATIISVILAITIFLSGLPAVVLTAIGVVVFKIFKSFLYCVREIYYSYYEINYDNIFKHTLPYVSVYNYDFNKYAIDKTKYYEAQKSQDNNDITKPVNADGNKFAYAVRYITDLLCVFNERQTDLLQSSSLLKLSKILFKNLLEESSDTINVSPNDKSNLLSSQDSYTSLISPLEKIYSQQELDNIQIESKDDTELIKKITNNIGCEVFYFNINDKEKIRIYYDRWIELFENKAIDYKAKKIFDASNQVDDKNCINIPNNFGDKIKTYILQNKNNKFTLTIEDELYLQIILEKLSNIDNNETITKAKLTELVNTNSDNILEFKNFEYINYILELINTEMIDEAITFEDFKIKYTEKFTSKNNIQIKNEKELDSKIQNELIMIINVIKQHENIDNINLNTLMGLLDTSNIKMRNEWNYIKFTLENLIEKEKRNRIITISIDEFKQKYAELYKNIENQTEAEQLKIDIGILKEIKPEIILLITSVLEKYNEVKGTLQKILPESSQYRFEFILQSLKITRCGLLYKDFEYVLHPHYRKIKQNDNTHTYEYYLPLIYPSTEEIMYGFCHFLNTKGYKYIWMCNKFNKKKIDENYEYGSIMTFPISGNDNDNPICIIISPDHTEGFSFTNNPAIFIPALCKTAGDQEQVHGRILRKYKDHANKGRYNKMMYQYFGGSNSDLYYKNQFAILYAIDENNSFDISDKNEQNGWFWTTYYIKKKFREAIKASLISFINQLGDNLLEGYATHVVKIEYGQNSGPVLPEEEVSIKVGDIIKKLKNFYPSEEFQLIDIDNIIKCSKTYFKKLTDSENNSYNIIIKDSGSNIKSTIISSDLSIASLSIIAKEGRTTYCQLGQNNCILQGCRVLPTIVESSISFQNIDKKALLTYLYKNYNNSEIPNIDEYIRVFKLNDENNFKTFLTKFVKEKKIPDSVISEAIKNIKIKPTYSYSMLGFNVGGKKTIKKKYYKKHIKTYKNKKIKKRTNKKVKKRTNKKTHKKCKNM